MNKLKGSTEIPKKEIDVNELEEQAKKLTARKVSGKSPTPPIIEKEVKINVLLPKTLHWKFKTICMFRETNMQDKALEIITSWLNKQADVF